MLHHPKQNDKRELRNVHSSPDLRSLASKLTQIKRRLNNSKNGTIPQSTQILSSPSLDPQPHPTPKPSPNPEPAALLATGAPYKSQIKEMEKAVTKMLLDFDGWYGRVVKDVEKVVEDGVKAYKLLEERLKGELAKVKDNRLGQAEKMIEGFIKKSTELKKKPKDSRKDKDLQELMRKSEEISECLDGNIFKSAVDLDKYSGFIRLLSIDEFPAPKYNNEPQSTPQLCSLRIQQPITPKKRTPRMVTEESDRAVVFVKRSRRTNKQQSPTSGFRSLGKLDKGRNSLGIIDLIHERPSHNTRSPQLYNTKDFMGILQQQRSQYQAMKQQLNLF